MAADEATACCIEALTGRLRRETESRHRRLEAALGLLDTPLGLPAYTALLERFYGFHATWEPAMARLLDEEDGFGPRRRLAHLRRDLLALGVSASSIAALPHIGHAVLPRDRREALGALYVLEGSTLGGAVIARHLRREGAVPEAAMSYFAGRGKATATMWRDLCASLDETPAEQGDGVVRGACMAFDSLQAWLCGERRERVA